MIVRSDSKQTLSTQNRTTDNSQMRAHNAGVLLRHIWSMGEEGVSRAGLSRQCELSRSTVSGIISQLLDAGLIHESHQARSTGGRPPIVLRFVDQHSWIVGVELGASHVSAVLCDLRGRLRLELHTDHDVQGDPDGSVRLMEKLIARCLAHPVVRGKRVIGIGVGVPCPIDPAHPDQLSTRILPRWGDIRLGAMLHSRFGLPTFIDNDANFGALAERWWGAGRGHDNFAYIKVATGVGAGLIIDSQIFRGSGGIAGEIGHTTIDTRGPRCRCGLSGCLEAMIGTASLLRRYHSLSPGSHSRVTGLDDIIDLADAGDPVAEQIIGETGGYLGIAVANLLNIFNPACVVLGGSLTRVGDRLLRPLRETIQERALWHSIAGAEVCLTTLGDEAIAVGAATQVLAFALNDPTLFQTTQQRS
ncbi:MAG: putative NBD/HSP70 family sugar kinase [Myxococcota bacterium]|jgi:predicted NBD/HSP70 family sugar kinase